MSDKNLFLGDTTYPHLAASTNENICAQLRKIAPDLVEHHTKQIVFAADRIEQLERLITQEQNRAGRIGTHSDTCHTWGHQHYECLLRKFEEAQKGNAQYEYVRKFNLRQFSDIYLESIYKGIPFDDLVDAAIQEGK